jgi:hypothetical protein
MRPIRAINISYTVVRITEIYLYRCIPGLMISGFWLGNSVTAQPWELAVEFVVVKPIKL